MHELTQPEWLGERDRPDVGSWSSTPPTSDEFTLLIDDLGCSDCVYDYFFWLIPHLLDTIEKCDDSTDRNLMLYCFGFRFIQAVGQKNRTKQLVDILEASIPRVAALVTNAISCDSRGRHLHFATLAACHGEPDTVSYTHLTLPTIRLV